MTDDISNGNPEGLSLLDKLINNRIKREGKWENLSAQAISNAIIRAAEARGIDFIALLIKGYLESEERDKDRRDNDGHYYRRVNAASEAAGSPRGRFATLAIWRGPMLRVFIERYCRLHRIRNDTEHFANAFTASEKLCGWHVFPHEAIKIIEAVADEHSLRITEPEAVAESAPIEPQPPRGPATIVNLADHKDARQARDR